MADRLLATTGAPVSHTLLNSETRHICGYTRRLLHRTDDVHYPAAHEPSSGGIGTGRRVRLVLRRDK
eukprot:7702-Eustigmatos_ZCMA.PRE.1